ncbi:MAG: aspartate--ammonia ligase [Firmicutes bacterium]|nr:aspartate--ammonia ligase [Bacillota bacterium]
MMKAFPEGYQPRLNIIQTQVAIKKIKDFFERDLAIQLNLRRVSAPVFVNRASGLNDTLNGVERPVDFDIKGQEGTFEIVHSLAKWKRYALGRYGFKQGEGLYTDMTAIRRDEDVDPLHSVYVDQWDWEKIIGKENRNEATLRDGVKCIYRAMQHTENYIRDDYNWIEKLLPEKLTFVTAQELEDEYPDLSPKERETMACREYGAIFLKGIGGKLRSGQPHDGRAPDYDDWSLNGDILVYYPILGQALELSSMGIRVDEETLIKQMAERGVTGYEKQEFHKKLLSGALPYTMGGGIGQSRICMLFLRKAHIGEVQSSYWPEEVMEEAAGRGIALL